MNTKILFIFFALNFGALALGSYFIGSEITSEWYVGLNKAPWTPPGYTFGIAWTIVMICFSLFMTIAYENTDDKKMLIGLFSVQWILNVSWNAVFFSLHEKFFAMVIIFLLTLLIFFFLLKYRYEIKEKALLLLPYFIWILIAASLNAYIYINN